jgi:23S rRNA (uracil1939-C5)-methyltransferase
MLHPLPKSPLFSAEITGLSHEGRGITAIDGKVVFLAGGLPGEIVEFLYVKKHRQYDEGQVVNVLKPAPIRVTPQCKHFGICGGCSLQHMASDEQIGFKQQMLLEQLVHSHPSRRPFPFAGLLRANGGVQPHTILPPLRSPAFGYRNKARLGVKFVQAKGKVLVGFRETNGRFLADLESCLTLHPTIGQKITPLSELIGNLAAFRSIPQLEIAIGEDQAAVVFRHLTPLIPEDIQKLRQFAQEHSLHIYLQADGIKSITKLWPEDNEPLLSYFLPEYTLELRFHPSDFTQINPYINRQMVRLAVELLAPNKQESILDLFCGLGNFTLPLAKFCHQIVGIEGEPTLVERARQNAIRNGIENSAFFSFNLTENFLQNLPLPTTIDKILLDPPRTGALEAVKILTTLNPKAILYVSCNPATLARDAKELINRGYALTKVCALDMFPHTSHVESMALFAK